MGKRRGKERGKGEVSKSQIFCSSDEEGSRGSDREYNRGIVRVIMGGGSNRGSYKVLVRDLIGVLMWLSNGFYWGYNMGSIGHVSLRINKTIGLLAKVLTRV